MFFRIMRFRWVHINIEISDVTSLERPSPYLFCLTRAKSLSKDLLTNFEYIHSFHRYSPSNFKVDQTRAKFCIFLAPEIFSEYAPKNFGQAL